MTKKPPIYDINDVHEVANKGNVNLERNAAKDSKNLGYTDVDVCKCMATLSQNDYFKSIVKPNSIKSGPDLVSDVYKINYKLNDEQEDALYIKFRLSAKNHMFIGSFKGQ